MQNLVYGAPALGGRDPLQVWKSVQEADAAQAKACAGPAAAVAKGGAAQASWQLGLFFGSSDPRSLEEAHFFRGWAFFCLFCGAATNFKNEVKRSGFFFLIFGPAPRRPCRRASPAGRPPGEPSKVPGANTTQWTLWPSRVLRSLGYLGKTPVLVVAVYCFTTTHREHRDKNIVLLSHAAKRAASVRGNVMLGGDFNAALLDDRIVWPDQIHPTCMDVTYSDNLLVKGPLFKNHWGPGSQRKRTWRSPALYRAFPGFHRHRSSHGMEAANHWTKLKPDPRIIIANISSPDALTQNLLPI